MSDSTQPQFDDAVSRAAIVFKQTLDEFGLTNEDQAEIFKAMLRDRLNDRG